MAVNFPQWMSVYPKIDKYKETQRYSYHSETAKHQREDLESNERESSNPLQRNNDHNDSMFLYRNSGARGQ